MKLFPNINDVNNRIFYILIITTFVLSVILTIETVLLGFAFHHNIKWLMMLALSIIAYWQYRTPKNRTTVHHVFFLMLTFILLPLGWLYSPINSPFTIAYACILAAAICFFFDRGPRMIYLLGLIAVCTGMMYLEHFNPGQFPVMAPSQRITDIAIQMPLTLTVLSIMLTAFANTLRRRNLQLDKLSKTDELTGLYNRRYVYTYLDKMQHCITGDCYIGILDIDNFKAINDTYGHLAGDVTIKSTADQLVNLTDSQGIVGRLGGDEFILILRLENMTIDSFCQSLNKPFQIELGHGKHIDITLSGGFSPFDNDDTIDDVITSADKRLYQSKQSGKAKVIC